MTLPINTAFDLTFLDLDQELSALEWSKSLPQPPESVVNRITDMALYEYSLRAFGDFTFNGLSLPLLDLSSCLLSGRPVDRLDDYRV
jgi:hypothetical protein